MDPIKVDFSNKKGERKKEIVIPPEKAVLKILLSVLCMLVFAAIAFYVMIPAINLKDYSFYLYIGMVAASYVVFNGLFSKVMSKPEYIPYVKRRAIVPGILIAVLLVTVGIGYLVSSEFFRADSYGAIIEDVEYDGAELANDIEQANLDKLPKLDNSSATELATKALGDLADKNLVSQFVASTESTQINLDGVPTRVVPLEYANIIKWFTNTKDGLPGFVKVDMAKEEAEYVEATIKYSTKEYFNEKLERHLRFSYPTYMFGDANFEVQETGKGEYKPYWIVPVLDKTIGLFGGTDVKGAVKVDAETGDHVYYSIEEFKNNADLKWVDRVYDSDLLVEQYNFHSKYGEGLGFWNSILSQKGVKTTTSGYNFIAKDDDVWMYTGVTSVTSDNSITGFVLINQRTKETKYYNVTGGTEAAAQGVAEGRVQELGYIATFPIIVDIDGQPTYFMSLMDKYNVRQQFALIHVENFNKIGATGKTLNACLENYTTALEDNGITVDIDMPAADDSQNEAQNGEQNSSDSTAKTAQGVVADIRTAVKGGESYYYVKLDSNDAYFSIAASKAETVVILNKGDSVTITYSGEGAIISADSLKLN